MFVLRGAGYPIRLASLRHQVVDGADDENHGNRRLEDGDIAERTEVRDVRQRAHWRIARRPGPHEVEEHTAAPHQCQDVDHQSPAAQLERRAFGGPAPATGDQDRDVSQQVGEVNHPGGGDCHQPGPRGATFASAVAATYLWTSPGMARIGEERMIVASMSAPMTAATTALHASLLGFLVSSARVLAVMNA